MRNLSGAQNKSPASATLKISDFFSPPTHRCSCHASESSRHAHNQSRESSGLVQEFSDAPFGEVTSPRDFIHPKIDVFAQYALIRMSKADPAARADALGMLAAVKANKLAGIYKEDERFPALRARNMGLTWWELIPKGFDAAIIPDLPPFIVFRDSVRSNPAHLDPALRKAWNVAKPVIFPQLSLPEANTLTKRLGLVLSPAKLRTLGTGGPVSISDRPKSEISRFKVNLKAANAREKRKRPPCPPCDSLLCVTIRRTQTSVTCLCLSFPLIIQIRGCFLKP
jgi:hypothetical protein